MSIGFISRGKQVNIIALQANPHTLTLATQYAIMITPYSKGRVPHEHDKHKAHKH